MIVTSWQERVMITRTQLTVVMWVPCPWSQLTGKGCNVVTKRIPVVLGHFVNRTVLQLAQGIEMINHIYFGQIIAANGAVLFQMIIDSSGKGSKVWKSEVISPAVIVDSGSGSHVGSFRVDCTGSKQTNYTWICFIRKPNNTIRILIGLCKFWGPWAHRVILNIVVYGIVL